MSSFPLSLHSSGSGSVSFVPASDDDLHYATFSSRVLAFLIDSVLLALFLEIMTTAALTVSNLSNLPSIWFPLFASLFSILIVFVYFSWFHTFVGQTFGKIILGIKVTNMNGETASLARSLFRSFGYCFSLAFFFGGFLWVIFDKKRQGWHDKLAGTVVLEA